MTVRTESAPAHLGWLLMAPAAFGALLLALFSTVRRRAASPALPRMSDEWLRTYRE